MNTLLIICLLCLFSQTYCDGSDLVLVETEDIDTDIAGADQIKPNARLFKPTTEWQVVGEDDVLPKGLHVRINLETGKKEAKILETQAELDSNSKVTSNFQKVEHENVQYVDEKYYKALNKLSKEGDQVKHSISAKSIEEIKDDFEKLKPNIKSEMELVDELFDQYNREQNVDNKLTLLSDFEYYVHSIDLANRLFNNDQFVFLLKDLNSTNTALKVEILNVLGSALQGNMQIKHKLFQTDFLRSIVFLLVNNKDVEILKKSIFVLSAFTRQFPLAQKGFFEKYQGITILKELLDKDLKLSLKIITYLADLALEHSNVLNLSSKKDEITVYESIDYASRLKNSSLCEWIVSIIELNISKSDLIILVESMTDLTHVCYNQFYDHLELFKKTINTHASEDYLVQVFNNFVDKFNKKVEL